MAKKKRYYWLKLPEDFFKQKQIKKLRKMAGGDTFTIIYLKLQLLSLKNEGAVIFEGVEENIIEELALELDEEPDDITMTWLFLQNNDLIEVLSEDEYLLPKAVECMGSEGDSANRMREHRKRKQIDGASQSDGFTSQCAHNVLSSDTEREKEKEIDKEREVTDKPVTRSPYFKKPNIEDIKAYCIERGYDIDPVRFHDYYESNGWMVGKSKMKDWKAAVRNWQGREKKQSLTSKLPSVNIPAERAAELRNQ